MYRIFFFAVACIVSCHFMVLSADATTYRYLDANGTTCYADDLSSVPSQFQSRAVIVVDKQAKGKNKNKPNIASVQGTTENKSEKNAIQTVFFRFNWLFLACLLAGGFFTAHRIQKGGKIALALKIRAASVFLVVCLAAAFNRDITDIIIGAVHGNYSEISSKIKAQEERDKKPLKTLSEKVDEMMQQVQQ